MRGFLRASSTARVLAVVLVSCAERAPRVPSPRPRDPPPNVLVVAIDQVALRTSAWVELHAWLGAAARTSTEIGDPELDGAIRAYAGVLAEDDRDEALGRTTWALEACNDERCARAAVTGSAFAKPYLESLPIFLGRYWTQRATIARESVEIARTALGPELEPLGRKVAESLAIDWPSSPAIVDVVAEAPEPGREAPIRVLLGARGSCFARAGKEPDDVHNARIVDCVLGHAAARLDGRSALASALGAALQAESAAAAQDLRRAWTALVVHAVAVTVSAWERKHVSVLRRSAAAVMPDVMAWLADEWPSRLRGEPAPSFAKRYAAALAGEARIRSPRQQ